MLNMVPYRCGLGFTYGVYALFALGSWGFVHQWVQETRGMELEAMPG